MGRNINNKKRISGLEMKIIIIDWEIPNYACTDILDGRNMRPINKNQFKEYLLWMDEEYIEKWLPYEDSEIYFVNVKDQTWNEFKTKNSKRLELNEKEFKKLLHKASGIFLIDGNHIKSCMYYPWRNRII